MQTHVWALPFRMQTWIFFMVSLAEYLQRRFFPTGWRWTWNCCRLFLYALILFPGFIQVGTPPNQCVNHMLRWGLSCCFDIVQMVFYYYFSRNVERSIPYGRKVGHRMCNLLLLSWMTAHTGINSTQLQREIRPRITWPICFASCHSHAIDWMFTHLLT